MTQFKDVAHLYLGCKIKTEEGIGTLDEISTEKSDDVTITSYDLVHAYLRFDEFKPILRPLSDMTDEEEKASRAMYHNAGNYNFGIAAKTNYLLSLGFDLFGLIENGEAITLTNTNKS